MKDVTYPLEKRPSTRVCLAPEGSHTGTTDEYVFAALFKPHGVCASRARAAETPIRSAGSEDANALARGHGARCRASTADALESTSQPRESIERLNGYDDPDGERRLRIFEQDRMSGDGCPHEPSEG